MATNINTLIPGITHNEFVKLIKALGATAYSIPKTNTIIIGTPFKDRASRKTLIQNVGKMIKAKNVYKDDGRAGFLTIDKTKAKVYIKPATVSGGIILKPSLFDRGAITDKAIPWSKYVITVKDAIMKTTVLDSYQKDLLIGLVDHTDSPSIKTKQSLPKIMKSLGNIQLSTINNDFGEILGPIAVMRKKLIPGIDSRSAKVFIPGRSNEPLLDYKILDNTNVFKISAKSGETTNTLKPGDVYTLINNSTKHKRKFSVTLGYKVIEILTQGSWKQGPIDACWHLKQKGGAKFKTKLDWLKAPVYSEATRQRCETILTDVSRTDIDFTDMFIAATNSEVWYVKFRIEPNGNMEFKLADRKADAKLANTKVKRIQFRSKNYVGRPNGEKLGFQV